MLINMVDNKKDNTTPEEMITSVFELWKTEITEKTKTELTELANKETETTDNFLNLLLGSVNVDTEEVLDKFNVAMVKFEKIMIPALTEGLDFVDLLVKKSK